MNHEELFEALGGDAVARQAANCLMREYGSLGVTPEFLATLRADDLLDIRNFGAVSLARVERFLAEHGKELRKIEEETA